VQASSGLQPSFGKKHPPCAAGSCRCSPGALNFHKLTITFLTPESSSSFSIPSRGWVWSGKGLESNQPHPGERKGELAPSHSHARGLAHCRSPRSVCSRGPVAFQLPWALHGWCPCAGMPGRCRWRGRRCRGSHVPPHRAHRT